MPPVRRKTKAIVMVDPEDILYLDIGPPPRVDVRDDGRWRRLWAKRWPAEGAALMDALPLYTFEWALRTFGDPRRRRSAPRTPPTEDKGTP